MARATTHSKKKTSKKKLTSSVKKKTARKKPILSAKKASKTTKASKKKTSTSKKKSTKKKVSKSASKARAAKKASNKKAVSKKKVSKAKVAASKKTTTPRKAPTKTKQPSKAKTKITDTPHEVSPEVLAELNIPTIEEAMANLIYEEGQFIVHPKYGLGMVDRIIDRKLSTRSVPCLEISFGHQEMKLTIPVDQIDRSGLRRPISKGQIDDIFKVLKGRATFDTKRRSAKRVADYRKRLNLGDPTSLAEAVRDLGRLSLKKSLSYEERKLLSTALRILTREVALARGREPDSVREEIEAIVYR